MTMAFPTVTTMLLVLTILQSARVNGFRRWNDVLLEPDFMDVRDDCSGETCLSIFPKKRDGELEDTYEKPSQVSRVLKSYHVMGRPWQLSCPCETQYDILDLGLENYPRYLATARCAPKTCFNKFNQCKLIHYKIHILRQRGTTIGGEGSEEQQYVEQIALPESLRMNWQMKPMKIAVACIANDGKKN